VLAGSCGAEPSEEEAGGGTAPADRGIRIPPPQEWPHGTEDGGPDEDARVNLDALEPFSSVDPTGGADMSSKNAKPLKRKRRTAVRTGSPSRAPLDFSKPPAKPLPLPRLKRELTCKTCKEVGHMFSMCLVECVGAGVKREQTTRLVLWLGRTVLVARCHSCPTD
jgi:hypothetical protein